MSRGARCPFSGSEHGVTTDHPWGQTRLMLPAPGPDLREPFARLSYHPLSPGSQHVLAGEQPDRTICGHDRAPAASAPEREFDVAM